ncbi:hypothetical protein ACKUVQ_19325 [Mycobacterium seoulense]|uniref:hypothetical protein n=1 Tax=Mycobacterium TaxID=1763 RepID=UPI0007FF07F9|nr:MULTISPECIES: hypothetical protein [unclassified Mycobacterium]OBH09813.1 hypothetical protein A9X04_21265 [Mycobacterium sp. E3247]
MDVNSFRGAEQFIQLWCLYERGFAEGMAAAIRVVEELMCGDDTTDHQREVLLVLADSLRKAKKTRMFGDS